MVAIRPLKIVSQFHDGVIARMLDDGKDSGPFRVTNGVKQGCALATTLFCLIFSVMLTYDFRQTSPSIPIRYRYDWKIFRLRRLRAVTKLKESVNRDLLFADGCALNATKGGPTKSQEMQHDMEELSSACDNYYPTISTRKTEIDVPACTREPIARTEHHSEGTETADRGTFYLPRQHTLLLC